MAKKYKSIKGKSSLPLPDSTTFYDNDQSRDGVKFFQYWQNLPEDVRPIAKVRVYRVKPPQDLTKIGSKVKSIKVFIGNIPFAAEDYQRFFYEADWAGGGDYRCSIEEKGLSGEACDTLFSLPDWDTYPPKVVDAALMLESNAAKEYVQWRARRNDPIGGQPIEESSEEDDFMEVGVGKVSSAANAASAVVTMAEGMVKMAERVADGAQERNQPAASPAPAPASSNPPDTVVEKVSNMWESATSSVVKMVTDNSGKQYDPVTMARGLIEIMPKPTDNTPMFQTILQVVQNSNDAMLKMVLAQNQELKTELAEIRKDRGPDTAVVQHKSLTDELQEFATKAELLGYKKSDGASAAAAETNKSDIVRMVVENMPMINAAIAAIGSILIPMFNRGPAPAPAPAPAAAPVPMTTVEQVPTPPAPPQPPTPQQINLHFLQSIEQTFIAHLVTQGFDGFSFAQHILSGGTGTNETIDGRIAYNQIKKNLGPNPDGSCGLDKLIRAYPPIWKKCEGDIHAYSRFLAEFFNYDENIAEQNKESAEQRV